MQRPNTPLFEFDTIGSRFWLEDLMGNRLPVAITSEVISYVQQFDMAYSRFKQDSLVMQLAAAGVLHDPPAELLAMLQLSQEMYLASGGAFNITVGAALSKLGYGSAQHAGRVMNDPWEHIHFDKRKVTVPKGMVIDFGGLGKGWLIDKIAGILRAHGIERFIVNGGGDLYVQNIAPVKFALENPLTEGCVLQTVHIQQGALAGSNTIRRAWETRTGRKHHIINPATEDSSDSGVIASYVMADTALMADIMATILIINPALQKTLEQKYNLKTLLLTT